MVGLRMRRSLGTSRAHACRCWRRYQPEGVKLSKCRSSSRALLTLRPSSRKYHSLTQTKLAAEHKVAVLGQKPVTDGRGSPRSSAFTHPESTEFAPRRFQPVGRSSIVHAGPDPTDDDNPAGLASAYSGIERLARIPQGRERRHHRRTNQIPDQLHKRTEIGCACVHSAVDAQSSRVQQGAH